MTDVDDATLLDRARHGDRDAFSRLFASHQQAVFRFASYLCGRDAGDDLVQETFLAVLKQRDGARRLRGPLRAYLLGIARHLALERLARRYVPWVETPLADAAEDLPAAGDLDALAGLSRAETVERVRGAIQALPAVYREVVALCELEELDYATAAAVLGCPIGTVRSRLHRARGLLTRKLSASPLVSAARGEST